MNKENLIEELNYFLNGIEVVDLLHDKNVIVLLKLYANVTKEYYIQSLVKIHNYLNNRDVIVTTIDWQKTKFKIY